MATAAMPYLGDFSDAAVNYTADQIYAAVNDFNNFIAAARASCQNNATLYQQNASAMKGDQLAAAQAALDAENIALQQLDYYNNLANNYVNVGQPGLSGLGYLGDDSSSVYGSAAVLGAAGLVIGAGMSSPTIVIISLLVGASIAAAYSAWQVYHERTVQAVTAVNQVQANAMSTAASALLAQYTAGQITLDQYTSALQKIRAGTSPGSPGLDISQQDLLLYGGIGLLGLLGFAWLSR